MLAAKMSVEKMPDMEMGCQDVGGLKKPGLGVTNQQSRWQNSHWMLTAQKHAGMTGVQREITGILTVRTAQDPTLLPRSGQGRVVGISALHAKCGVRSFVGQQHSAGAWKEVPEYPDEDNKNQNQEEQCRACQDDRHMHLPKKQRR